MLFPQDLELKRRIEIAAALQRRAGITLPLLHDPIEDEDLVAPLIERVRAIVDAQIDSKIRMGRCHCIWTRMKAILKEEHGIVWYSPREMNPGVEFD